MVKYFLTNYLITFAKINFKRNPVNNILARGPVPLGPRAPMQVKMLLQLSVLLPASRYARAGTSYCPVSVSVCSSVSVTSRCSIESDERIDVVIAYRLFSTSPTLCCKEIQVSTKTRVLSSGT